MPTGVRIVVGCLDGFRVVDLSTVLMGPYTTQTLGDMGADVIKVESLEGDLIRQIGPSRHEGMGHVFLNANRSKRSIALDLKSPEGKEVLRRLIKDAHVLLYNIRPKAMARLGFSYDDVTKINPSLIYAGVFGYGENGPYAGRPAYDDLIQGAAGLPGLFMAAGESKPRYVPCAVSDRVTGLIAVSAILGALVFYQKTGKGQRIDVPMFETMAGFVLGDHLGGRSFDPPIGKPGYVRILSSERRPSKTKDGYVCAMIYNDKHWAAFAKAMGSEAPFTADPRFKTFANRIKHSDEVLARIAELFLTRTTREWIDILDAADIPVMPMHNLETIFQDPHLQAVGFFSQETHPSEGSLVRTPPPGYWSETQPKSSRPAPRLGEHTAEILAEAGYGADEIARFLAQNIARNAIFPSGA